MTTQLKVIGKEHIGKIEFTGIEGGFGDDKKAMLGQPPRPKGRGL